MGNGDVFAINTWVVVCRRPIKTARRPRWRTLWGSNRSINKILNDAHFGGNHMWPSYVGPRIINCMMQFAYPIYHIKFINLNRTWPASEGHHGREGFFKWLSLARLVSYRFVCFGDLTKLCSPIKVEAQKNAPQIMLSNINVVVASPPHSCAGKYYNEPPPHASSLEWTYNDGLAFRYQGIARWGRVVKK